MLAVFGDPSLAGNPSALARSAGIGRSTIASWQSDPAFRKWWDRNLLDLARSRMGEAALTLFDVIHSSRSDTAKVKAVEAVTRIFGQPQQGLAEALTSILERYGRGVPSRVRAVEEEGRTAVEIVTGDGAESYDRGSDNSHSVKLDRRPPPPPPEAMAIPPAERDALSEAARSAAVEAERSEAISRDPLAARMDPNRSRLLASPGRNRGRLRKGGGAVENHKPDPPEQQDPAGTVNPTFPPPDAAPSPTFDPWGRPFTPRRGDKPPPSGNPTPSDEDRDPFT